MRFAIDLRRFQWGVQPIPHYYSCGKWLFVTTPAHSLRTKRAAVLFAALGLLVCASTSLAVTIVSGPMFAASTNAPLAGLLQISTDVESRVVLSVTNQQGSWSRSFPQFSRVHSIPVAGFKPSQTNLLYVTVIDQAQSLTAATQPLTFVSPALPQDFPVKTVLHSEPAAMEPGYTLFIVQNRTAKTSYITMLDSAGRVVWYAPTPALADVDVRQLPNGDFFIEEPGPLNRFLELDLLGQTVQSLPAPAQYPVNNHEAIKTDHGTILYLSDVSKVVSNFPSNVTNSQAPRVTATVDDNPIVEFSATNGAVLHAWSPLDLLDPTRVTYLTYQFKTTYGVDNEHANAIFEDPSDNSIIVSVRTQNAVFKVLRQTGQLKWILGSPGNWSAAYQPYLLSPVGTPFSWNYGQHAPQLTPRHTLLLYDDGNDRADPFDPPVPDQDNYSRAVEYNIDETNRQVAQVWQSSPAPGDRIYTGAVGNADWLPVSTNVLITYGLVSYVNGARPSATAPNATMVRLREMTHDLVPKVVFDVSFFDSSNTSSNFLGYLCYRSHRVPDFYAHPLVGVQDLNVRSTPGGTRLQFSGDPFCSYVVQASADLSQWQQLGSALPDANGTFTFVDATPGNSGGRFYRVLTR
jgi:arylsulfate sulfotransferase